MAHQTIETVATHDRGCDPAAGVTKSLLGYGVIAGPIYVTAWLAQALTRDGFDLTRHPASVLANGDLGWIQMTNLILTGLMTIAAAVGVRRAFASGRGAIWAPRLLGTYGAALVVAGIFRADPMDGFPVGTPAGPAEASWHGIVHFVGAGIGFWALIAACLIIGRRFRSMGDRGWGTYSTVTGVLFFAAFIGIASGSANAAVNVAFGVAVVLGWAWLSALCVRLYRTTAR